MSMFTGPFAITSVNGQPVPCDQPRNVSLRHKITGKVYSGMAVGRTPCSWHNYIEVNGILHSVFMRSDNFTVVGGA